ncbi:DNA methyltransferase [Egicoccus sp. AB-alg2]|uniref:DNA methyltransferase n=1 Tax=Egicoccus sp. AB-alg2 TaxID=3242693 RepID=UPI00359CCFE2
MPVQESFALDRAAEAPTTVLGQQYSSLEAAHRSFEDRLRSRLDEMRDVPGFPEATDTDVLDLSVAPHFTACPNPFLGEYVELHRTSTSESQYPRGPYVGTLDAGSRDAVYSFHPYHTKVPPDVIRRLIEHYTQPGDLVLDAFCGSGMTGAAARRIGRNAVLVDLSPMATFVAGANVVSHDPVVSVNAMRNILHESKAKWGHLFQTEEGGHQLAVNYFVWSDEFTCPDCQGEFCFFPHGVIHHGNKVETRDQFPCPHCDADLNVRRVQRIIEDGRKRKRLVWVNAGKRQQRISREPNAHDLQLAAEASRVEPDAWYPTDSIDPAGYSARLAQLGDKAIVDVTRFLAERNLIAFADLWARADALEDPGLRQICRATLTSIFTVISERQGYFGGGGGMSGNFYMPIVRMEKNIFDVLERKLGKLEQAEKEKLGATGTAIVSTQSSTQLTQIPDDSIDYIYTDPPFGANIIYSELNLVLEAWLRVKTNEKPEAVIDESRRREADDYSALLRACFAEMHRVLKPGRWMSVEFHNTDPAVWKIIQDVIREAGFSVEHVGMLDKGTSTILSDIRPGAARHDLIITARKAGGHRADDPLTDGDAAQPDLWGFVEERLQQLPIPGLHDDAHTRRERSGHVIFSRMVAWHLENGREVPISAADFYRELERRFPKRDGLHLLPSQLPLLEGESETSAGEAAEEYRLF